LPAPAAASRSGTPAAEADSSRAETRISPEQIQSQAPLAVEEVLDTLPGTDVQSRGPLGIQNDLAVNGSTFSQTLLLVDDLPLRDPQTGHNRLDLPLPPCELESVDLLPGHASARFGSEAFGGTVNLATRPAGQGPGELETFGGDFGTLLIGLAPYYLPTFTLISVLVRPLIPAGWFPWFDGFIGTTLAFHICSTPEETKQAWTKRSFTGAGDNQKTKSDIGKVGFIFAFLVIAGFGLFLMGLALQLIGSGYAGTWQFLKQVGKTSYEDYAALIREIYSNLAPTLKQWFS